MASAFVAKRDKIVSSLVTPVSVKYNEREIECVAIWDTGATNSCISMAVVDALKPVSTGKRWMSTPNGKRLSDTYIMDIVLPNNVVIPDLVVCDAGIEGVGMLIGMDIISQGDFAVTHYNEKTVFTYRHPSASVIDFEKGLRAADIIGKPRGNPRPPQNRRRH